MQIFMLRNKPHNIERINEFLKANFVAIGWTATGDLSSASKEDIRNILKSLGYEGQSLLTNLGMVNAFVNTAQEGDIVLTRQEDTVHIGVMGPYFWDEEYVDQFMAHTRPVEWKAHVPFKKMNASVASLLKNIRTICRYKGTLEESELKDYIYGIDLVHPIDFVEEESIDHIKEEAKQDLISSTLETLKDLKDNSKDDQVRLEAAKELLKYLKK